MSGHVSTGAGLSGFGMRDANPSWRHTISRIRIRRVSVGFSRAMRSSCGIMAVPMGKQELEMSAQHFVSPSDIPTVVLKSGWTWPARGSLIRRCSAGVVLCGIGQPVLDSLDAQQRRGTAPCNPRGMHLACDRDAFCTWSSSVGFANIKLGANDEKKSFVLVGWFGGRFNGVHSRDAS